MDPTTKLRVTEKNILYEQGSLAGFTQRAIPLRSVSSGFFGYRKPWKEAVVMAIVLGIPTLGLGALLALAYYYLNKQLTIGVLENGGAISSLSFKRSVIEGKKIDQDEGRYVIEIIELLLDSL